MVCVAVTTLGIMESDLGAQSSSYQKTYIVIACRVMLDTYILRVPVECHLVIIVNHIHHTKPLGDIGWSRWKSELNISKQL